MNLQSQYRLSRDGIKTYEDENLYFAYLIVENEIHILEVFIDESKRGDSKKFYDQMFKFFTDNYEVKFFVGFIVPKTLGAEISLKSLLNYNFKLLKCDNEKITLILER